MNDFDVDSIRAGERPPSVAEPAATEGGRAPRRLLRTNRAFTIVELLVAASITALIAGFIAVIVRNVSTVWTRSGNRLGTDAQVRLVLDQLQLDLQGAMFRDDGNVWFAADVLNSTGNSGLWQAAARNAKPATSLSLDITATRATLRADERSKLEHARYGVAGTWLRFFTTSRGSNTATSPATISAPVAVSYQIVRRFTASNPTNMNTAYLLHRSEVRPVAANSRPGVLESGFNLTAAPYTTGGGGNNTGAAGDPRSIRTPGTDRTFDSVIAENVIDFGIRCYVRDETVPGGLRLIFPVNANGALANVTSPPLRSQSPSSTPSTMEGYDPSLLFPDVVDVMVRILTDDGASQIANIEKVQTPPITAPLKYNSNAQEWWWGVAQENSRVYTRRIVVNARHTL
jgi:hypothetical protein